MTFKNLSTMLVASGLLLMPLAVSARVQLAGSIPVANGVARNAARVVVMFNEPVSGPSVRVELFMTGMPAGMGHGGDMAHGAMDHSKMNHNAIVSHAPVKVAATGQLGKDGKSIILTPKKMLGAGSYRVNWTATGADKQVASGSFDFSVR